MLHILDMLREYALPFLAVISVVVFVHEFGHYWVARRCGVKVEVFSIGFGHEIFGWNDKHGTRWKVSWLPLGGYVKMFGDGSAASTPDDSVHSMTDEEKKVAFFHQPVGKRMAVVVAGPAFNYLFAILVLSVLYIFMGQPYTSTDISDVLENSPAAKAGIVLGDHITSVDGNTVERFEDIQRIIMLNPGVAVPIELDRNGEHLKKTVTPEVVLDKDRFGGEYKKGQIGIKSSNFKIQKWSPPQAVYHAVGETWNLTTATLKAVGQIIMGVRSADQLGGPLRIAELSGKVSHDGLIALINLMAMISINLGLINLFPVPLLDGGHLAFYFYEKLRGKPLHDNVQEIGMRVGMILVVTLMVFATWNDLVHLKVISYLRNLFS